MRLAIFGAGAIGGVLGARLHESGHDVVLVARGAHHDAIRDDGLTLRTPEGEQKLRIPLVDSAAALKLGPGDAVLLCVKGQDTPAVLRSLAVSVPPEVRIACVQNGVENERAALRKFPNVYGVCVLSPCVHLTPGVVEAYASPVTGFLDVGRYPTGVDDFAGELADSFNRSTYESVPREDIMRWKYTKLLHNLGNAIEAVCGPAERPGELSSLAVAEGVACLERAGIGYVSFEEDRKRRGDLIRRASVGGRERPGGSTWQSFARGTGEAEVDYLSGEIVLLGRLHGVPTPVNLVLQELASKLAASHTAPGTISASEVMRLAGVGASS